MTHKEFCFWLEGFFMRGGAEPTADQWHEIGKRLHQTMNPVEVSSVAADVTRESLNIMSQHFDPPTMRLDECAQGEIKKGEAPIKTIADLACESLSSDITPSMVMKELAKEVKTITEIAEGQTGKTVRFSKPPFFTPQAPFKGEGY